MDAKNPFISSSKILLKHLVLISINTSFRKGILPFCLVVLAQIFASQPIEAQAFLEIEQPSKIVFGVRGIGGELAPAFVDIDGDHDLDIFMGEENGFTQFFENIGGPLTPAYNNPVDNPFGLTDNQTHSAPTFVDIDADGDYDCFIGVAQGLTFYFENIGTKFVPDFEPLQSGTPFGIQQSGGYAKPTFGDLDNDGDFDLLLGDGSGFRYMQNIGNAVVPNFADATEDIFGMMPVRSRVAPILIDIDSDGDLDIVTGSDPGNVLVYYNSGSTDNPLFDENDTRLLLRYYARYTVPTFGDLNSDGDLDMLVGHVAGFELRWYMGSDSDPIYKKDSSNNPLGIVDVGNFATPDLYDLDNDGDLDIIIGNDLGNLSYQKNIGNLLNPEFDTAQINPFGLFQLENNASPAFADIDGDNAIDLYYGDIKGDTWLFSNLGSSFNPNFSFTGLNPDGLSNIGDYSSPVFANLEGASTTDLFIGDLFGNIKHFINSGTKVAPSYTQGPDNPYNLADVGLSASPFFIDIDGDLDEDALIGGADGNIHFFRNIGTTFTPNFGPKELNPFGINDIGNISSPTAGDIDSDGDIDLLVGNGLGRTVLFENKPCKNSFPINHIINQQYLYQSTEEISSTASIGKVHDIAFIASDGILLEDGFQVAHGGVFSSKIGKCINN